MISNSHIANNCYCAKLRAAARIVTRIYDDALRPTGLKGNQFSVLVATSLMQPVSITHLADQLSMERTTLTRNLNPLEKLGYIQLEAGKGRTRNISMTAKGVTVLEQAKPLWDTAQLKMNEGIGDDQLSDATATLQQIKQL